MASTSFLLQGIDSNAHHLGEVEELLDLPNVNACLIGVAFLNRSGAELLAAKLKCIKGKLTFYVGIRNGITSSQALHCLLKNEIRPICIDTATQSFIFHSKVYLATNKVEGRLIVGSANFTPGGLLKNIESSLVSSLDMSAPDDVLLAHNVFEAFDTLRKNSPQNFIEINDEKTINELASEGILTDESAISFHATGRASKKGVRSNKIPTMKTSTHKVAFKTKPRHYSPKERPEKGTIILQSPINNNILWKSDKLSRRDLSIPTGSNTHATGSMLLKQGDKNQDINFQHYFRDEVFKNVSWVKDSPTSNTPHYERAFIDFRIIVSDIDYGIWNLKVSHNTDTTSKSYKQKNSMTQIHWGDAKSILGKEDLLGKYLYITVPEENTLIYSIIIADE